ncbi:hypothetical protein [Rhodoplanes azumiensis]|uniref:Uncharacterized protein n=1 Tax=Rhodoplanes azumiensis TaxID=1897628 RepID=A0ABW5ANN4_9BRAD
MTSRIVSAPIVQSGETLDGSPALLLSVGPAGWPVLITPDDFDRVTAATGFRLWGVQHGNVVVGDDDPRAGRPIVARLLLGFRPTEYGLGPAFRDGNPLNLLRRNLGITSRAAERTWWLVLRPGEVDKVYDLRGLSNYVPDAITRHRDLVPEPRPTSCPWPLPARTWHRTDPPKVATLDGPPPPHSPKGTPWGSFRLPGGPKGA